MFFSIIVPVFNKSYSIKKTLNSVLSQGYDKFEIVVVNDGSTDDSLIIIKEYFKSQIDAGIINLINQNNQGVSAARSNGVKNARYDLLCFLDGDDAWEDFFLEKMAELIKDFPDAAAYGLGHQVSKNNNPAIKRKNGLPDGFRGYVGDFFKASLSGPVLKSSKVCVRKEAFLREGGFPLDAVIGEDLMLWIRLALNNKIAYEDVVAVTVIQVADGSRSGRKNKVPYPILYFSNKAIENSMLKRYLFMIFYKHFFSSLLNFRFAEAYRILTSYFCNIKFFK